MYPLSTQGRRGEIEESQIYLNWQRLHTFEIPVECIGPVQVNANAALSFSRISVGNILHAYHFGHVSFRFVTNYLQSLHSSGLCCLLIAGIVSHNSLYFFALSSWQLARLVSRLVSRPLLLLPRPNCPHIRCPHFWLLVEICFHSTQKKVHGILGEPTWRQIDPNTPDRQQLGKI